MTAGRLAISLDPRLAEQIRAAAGPGSVSSWLADAAERKLRSQGLRAVVSEWEAEHGELTAAEKGRARRDLGLTDGR